MVTRSGRPVVGAVATAVDATDPAAFAAALTGNDVVFHCAQPAYHRWAEEFPALQRRVVAACEQVGATLVAVENVYGYGLVDRPMAESTPMHPHTEKGRIRAEMWRELHDAHAAGRIRVASVRASDFFGPGVVGSAFGERFFRGSPSAVPPTSSATQTRATRSPSCPTSPRRWCASPRPPAPGDVRGMHRTRRR